MEFKRMHTQNQVDVKSYLTRIKITNPDVKIHVGCDSQNYSNKTVFVTTVVVRFPKNGAQVIYKKEVVSKINDMWTRLWSELDRSIKTAEFIKSQCRLTIFQIEMDYNENPEFASHKVLKAAGGYVSSLGFSAKAKDDILPAVWAANVLCR